MLRFNTNEMVWVRLTRAGVEQYEREVPATYRKYTVSADGRWGFQLWELMQIFGPAMTMGGDVPFVDNVIEIPVGERRGASISRVLSAFGFKS